MRKQTVVLAALALLLSAPAYAQRTTATIRGAISDATQAVLPGVTVTVVNEQTGFTRATVTNEVGSYSLGELPPGSYKITAELQGFKGESRTGILVRVADDLTLDFQLATGQMSEVITVAGESPVVKTIGGDVSGVVTGEMVRELPLNGRNFLQLATLMPGVSAPDVLNVKDKGLLGGSDLSVSGSDVTANMWTVDGANNNDVGSNRTILIYPSLEAIEEFKILRNSYGPEFGGAGGAQINIVTREGGNRFHGTGFYSGRSDALNATNYFLAKANQPKEQLKRNDFGGSIGGPLVRDKLHFFGNLEWNVEDRGTPRAQFVPTEAERNGDFSGARIAGCSPPIPNDPLTGAPFPGNKIPPNRISQAGSLFLKLYALPNVTPGAGSCNNWVTSVTSPIRYNQQSMRVDWTMNQISRLMVRYTHDVWKNNSPSVQSNLWGDDPYPAVDSNWDQPSRSFVASLNQTVGRSGTNNLQFSYSANKIIINRGEQISGLTSQILGALQPVYPLSSKQYGDQTGAPVFWGGQGYGALWNEAPFRNNQDLFVLRDDYTRVFGKHLFKAGALASINKKNEDTDGNGSSMHSRFWGSAGVNGWGSTTGNILSDFLLRDMTFGFSEASTSRSAQQRWRDAELYAADSWQAAKGLTIDYGVRYSLFFNPYTTDNKITSFVPSQFNSALGADPCNGVLQPPGTNWCKQAGAKGGTDGPNNSLMSQDLNNIAPRLGMAWDFSGTGKSVMRAGLGRFFLRERLSPVLSIATNPPFVSKLNGLRKLDTTAEPCDGCFGTTLGAPANGREADQRTPNNWQWNATFQHEVWRNTTIEVGYVANYGYNLLKTRDANQVLSGDTNHNGIDDRLEFVVTTPANASLRQFGVFGNNSIGIWEHTGKSTYHSLQTQFISRFGRASQFQTSYTLSRSRANFNLTDSGGAPARGNATLDNQNPDLDWGRPETGRTHIFNASLIWLLPGLENHSSGVRAALGDWEIAGIVGAATGQPVTIYTGGLAGAPGVSLNGGPSGTGYTNNHVPNRVASEPCRASGGLAEQIINPKAYTLNGFQLGKIGTARRGDCDGPAYFQTDLAFYKNIPLRGTTKLQFRWDIFNIFNNTNFLYFIDNYIMNPSGVTVNNSDPTKATAITSATIPTSFGQATRTRDPRQMQIGFKIIW